MRSNSIVHRALAAAAAAFFMAGAALAQSAGTVTNHAFVIGKGPGQTGYTSLLCGSAQLAVGQAAADPICRTLSGDVTLSAAGVTAIGANKVTSAMLNADVFSTAHTWAGQQTFVAPILGTPAGATLTNATGLPISTGLTGAGTGVLSALGVNVGTAGAFVVNGGALGTPSSGTLTNATGLPIDTGVSGLGAGCATFLGTPSSANLRGCLTDESGTGLAYFQGGALGTPASGTLTNATGLPIATGVSGLGTGIASWLATPSSSNLAAALTDETGTGASVFAGSPALTGAPTAPTAAVDTDTTQIATTAFVIGQASAVADGTPTMNGTAARGTSTHFARADHVHPTDTSRAPTASPAFTGTPTAPTASAGDNSTTLATTAFVQAAVTAGTAGVASYNSRTGAVETTVADIGAGMHMINGSISESRSANAATYSILSQAGSTPSSSDKVKIAFTTATGGMVLRSVTSALSITIPSGTTLGSVSGLTSPLYVYAIDNAGTVELALSLKSFEEFGTVSTTAISGGGTSTVMYSTTARSSVRYTMLGVAYFNQTTAGSWDAAPSSIQLAPFVFKKYMSRVALSANQSVSATAFTKVNLNSYAFDDDGVWQSANYRYLAQEPGRYLFIGAAASAAGNAAAVYIYKNGEAQMAGPVFASASGPAQTSGIIDLVAGDYVELYFYTASSGESVYGSSSQTWLYGAIIR